MYMFRFDELTKNNIITCLESYLCKVILKSKLCDKSRGKHNLRRFHSSIRLLLLQYFITLIRNYFVDSTFNPYAKQYVDS